MNQFKGTPGPWIIEKTHEIIWVGTGKNNNTKVNDIVLHINNDNNHTDFVKQRIAANAALIAAAPEMLVMLQCIVDGVAVEETDINLLIHKATTI